MLYGWIGWGCLTACVVAIDAYLARRYRLTLSSTWQRAVKRRGLVFWVLLAGWGLLTAHLFLGVL